MTTIMPVETAQKDLKRLLDELQLGETVTLLGSEGVPQALLISLNAAERPKSVPDWDARWETLALKVTQAWKIDRSALEVLTEMRR